MHKVPFLDLRSAHAPLRDELIAAASDVITSGQYILGAAVERFEEEFAQLCDNRHCVGVANGTDALQLLLEAYIADNRLRAAGEVIVQANTYFATILAIIRAGLIPRLVDPALTSYNLTGDTVRAAINEQTVAVMAVHLYGRASPMHELKKICASNNLLLFADAAQAHGLRLASEPINTGIAGSTYSFYPTKNLGGLGDGGMIAVDDSDIANILRKLRNQGTSGRYILEYRGHNSRLDPLQAVLLSVKLPHLAADNARRQEIAMQYIGKNGISNKCITLPSATAVRDEHVWHVFVLRCVRRDELTTHLHHLGIGALSHYPKATHHQIAFAEYAPFADLHLPVTEQIADESLSLPLHPDLNETDAAAVIAAVNSFKQ